MNAIFGIILLVIMAPGAWAAENLKCQMTVFEGTKEYSSSIFSAELEGPDRFAMIRFEVFDHKVEAMAWKGSTRYITITHLPTKVGASSSTSQENTKKLSVILNQWIDSDTMRQNLIACMID